MVEFEVDIYKAERTTHRMENAPIKKKASEARMRANRKWEAKAYDQKRLLLPKGELDALKELAESIGESVNEFINKSIEERIERLNKEKEN